MTCSAHDPLSAAHPLFCPQRSQHKPAHVEEVRNHSCENETPEPLLGPVCFRGGSGWEFHGQRGEGGGRWDENSSKYCLIKARNDAAPSQIASPGERGPIPAFKLTLGLNPALPSRHLFRRLSSELHEPVRNPPTAIQGQWREPLRIAASRQASDRAGLCGPNHGSAANRTLSLRSSLP